MGLFRPESRAGFESPSVSLSDASLVTIFGGEPTVSGRHVNEEGAIGQTLAVYRAVSLLSGLVAGLPLKAYRYKDKQSVVVRALEGNMNVDDRTPFECWEQVMFHLLMWGNAYVEKIRNPLGSIIALRPINPARVKPRLFKAGEGDPNQKVYEVQRLGALQGVDPYTNYEIMHIPGPGYDGLMGLSPIGVARQSVGISQAAEELAGQLYGNGNMISGVLTTDQPLEQGQADALKARWREKVQGSRHAHDVAVLDRGTTFTPTSMPPEDAQFLQTRRWQTIEIARLYGIPPHLLGDVEKSTSWGSGIEQQNIAFVTYTLRPWLHRIEQRVTREIVEPSTQYAEFLIDGLLRGDSAQRAASYVSGIQWGYLTRNEVRVKENLQPLEGLDEPLTPLNMAKGDAESPLVPQDAPPSPTDSSPQGADVTTTA